MLLQENVWLSLRGAKPRSNLIVKAAGLLLPGVLIALSVFGPSLPCLAADVQFTATVDRTSLGLDESVTLTVQIQGSGLTTPKPKLPDFSDFRVLSGPNESSNFQFIKGRTSSSKTYTLVLQPRREGTLTIGSAELIFDKKLYRTDPITLAVGGGSSTPPRGAAPATPQALEPKVSGNVEDVFVQVSADQSQAFLNEQVVLSYTIYTRVHLAANEISKLPSMAGFWTEEFPPPAGGLDVRDVIVKGNQYRAAVIRRVAVFPTRTGELRIDPLEVTGQIQVLDRRRSRDPFDLLFDSPFMNYRTEERVIATQPLTLHVLPLPETGKPDNFNGAVGQFDLNVSLDRTTAKADEALTMTVSTAGSGNIKMLPRPNFKAPADFESYEPKESVQLNKSGGRITGSKVYEYVLIPRFGGRQRIPSISFSYFDPEKKAYQTLIGGGYDVNIERGASDRGAGLSGISKKDVELLGQDIHYLKAPGRLKPIAAATHLPSSFWLGMVLPPILAALLLGATRMAGASPVRTRLQAKKAYAGAQRDLRRLARIAALGPSAADRFTRFYGSAHRTLISYLGEKLNLPAQGLKEDEVLEQLSGRQMTPEQLHEIRDILNVCNYARFASGSDDASRMVQILKKMRRLIDDLEAGWEKMT